MGVNLDIMLSRTTVFGLKLWVLIGMCVGAFIMLVLAIMVLYVTFIKKSRSKLNKLPISQIPIVSKDINVVDKEAGHTIPPVSFHVGNKGSMALQSFDKSREKGSEKMLAHMLRTKSSEADKISQCSSSAYTTDRVGSSQSGDECSSSGNVRKQSSSFSLVSSSPLLGLPELSHLGWGHWFTLRDLEYATSRFAKENELGNGGYGVVYRGRLINGTEVAVKNLHNNMGQAEKEFRVEVEAIGHVRHKNLVRLLGYCVEGTQRMLVYEYVNNGNLEQWLHGAMREHGCLRWESRMKVILGTAKALAYLHEAIEPKVVHRDIKSSNILIDDQYNAKVSDFGLSKLLDSGSSHVETRVMGTFGYVAPEYVNTGLLNEKSDVYSFGVLLLEVVTGRYPVDKHRPVNEVNLVEWLKFMVGFRKVEEIIDPNLDAKPSTRVLKRTLLIALRCVDPDSEKRPKMGQVVRMLEAEEAPYLEERRSRRTHPGILEVDSPMNDGPTSSDFERKPNKK